MNNKIKNETIYIIFALISIDYLRPYLSEIYPINGNRKHAIKLGMLTLREPANYWLTPNLYIAIF